MFTAVHVSYSEWTWVSYREQWCCLPVLWTCQSLYLKMSLEEDDMNKIKSL